jgi:hypothetical protein
MGDEGESVKFAAVETGQRVCIDCGGHLLFQRCVGAQIRLAMTFAAR